jgi:hypothetical protein
MLPAISASVASWPMVSRIDPEMPLRAEAGIFSQSPGLKKARSVAR